jgi:hypothetical protein
VRLSTNLVCVAAPALVRTLSLPLQKTSPFFLSLKQSIVNYLPGKYSIISILFFDLIIVFKEYISSIL